MGSGATLTSEQVEELVSAYEGGAGARHVARHVARTRLWSTVCSWTWVLWASLQEAVGVVDHDHRPWAVEMHERARSELVSPELERLLPLADPALGDT